MRHDAYLSAGVHQPWPRHCVRSLEFTAAVLSPEKNGLHLNLVHNGQMILFLIILRVFHWWILARMSTCNGQRQRQCGPDLQLQPHRLHLHVVRVVTTSSRGFVSVWSMCSHPWPGVPADSTLLLLSPSSMRSSMAKKSKNFVTSGGVGLVLGTSSMLELFRELVIVYSGEL
ncbi:uncharacterized protein LOC124700095 [Lolium rigidum]|uniref:uncharacterized protein LOC124700095 n=1 Tax=Lolium rigidum TaxID=89674 RepID=UPI001F5CB89D|nr:uncharacterized protein LOC124700095 [Lolium rigidum]